MNTRSLPPAGRDDSAEESFRTELPPDLPAGDVFEVPLLMSGGQLSALERAAFTRGLTAGEMVRTLFNDFLTELAPSRPTETAPPTCKARAV
jgi:hypothetical protein